MLKRLFRKIFNRLTRNEAEPDNKGEFENTTQPEVEETEENTERAKLHSIYTGEPLLCSKCGEDHISTIVTYQHTSTEKWVTRLRCNDCKHEETIETGKIKNGMEIYVYKTMKSPLHKNKKGRSKGTKNKPKTQLEYSDNTLKAIEALGDNLHIKIMPPHVTDKDSIVDQYFPLYCHKCGSKVEFNYVEARISKSGNVSQACTCPICKTRHNYNVTNGLFTSNRALAMSDAYVLKNLDELFDRYGTLEKVDNFNFDKYSMYGGKIVINGEVSIIIINLHESIYCLMNKEAGYDFLNAMRTSIPKLNSLPITIKTIYGGYTIKENTDERLLLVRNGNNVPEATYITDYDKRNDNNLIACESCGKKQLKLTDTYINKKSKCITSKYKCKCGAYKSVTIYDPKRHNDFVNSREKLDLA